MGRRGGVVSLLIVQRGGRVVWLLLGGVEEVVSPRNLGGRAGVVSLLQLGGGEGVVRRRSLGGRADIVCVRVVGGISSVVTAHKGDEFGGYQLVSGRQRSTRFRNGVCSYALTSPPTVVCAVAKGIWLTLGAAVSRLKVALDTISANHALLKASVAESRFFGSESIRLLMKSIAFALAPLWSNSRAGTALGRRNSASVACRRGRIPGLRRSSRSIHPHDRQTGFPMSESGGQQR